MPSVTVNLKHTPKPEGEAVAVCECNKPLGHNDDCGLRKPGSLRKKPGA